MLTREIHWRHRDGVCDTFTNHYVHRRPHGCMCVTLNGNARRKGELTLVLLLPE